MRKFCPALAIVALCYLAVNTNAEDVRYAGERSVTLRPARAFEAPLLRVLGCAGQIGQVSRLAETVYDNTVNGPYAAISFDIGSEFGDELRMTAGGSLIDYTFAVYNASDGTYSLTAVDIELKFYELTSHAEPLILLGTYDLGTVTFDGDGLAPGEWAGLTYDLSAAGIDLPTAVVITQTYSNPVGDGNGTPTSLGTVCFMPPVTGTSGGDFWMGGDWWWT